MKAFTDWFNAQGFRHFGAHEFTRYFGAVRKGVKNSAPPKKLWKHVVPTLQVVDDLRESFGQPCTILSSYRSPDYNRTVGGAAQSQHLQFNALDITIKGVSAKRVYERLLQWRSEGRFKGGIGYYPSSGFVHLDTRGRNATWWGS